MRKVILLLLTLMPLLLEAQGIQFFHGSFDEAVQQAKTENKLLFVDCYTTWCGPCKRMAATTFVDAQVGSFFNDKFVSFKLDMETPEGEKFAKKYPVSAYPTLWFIDGEGNAVTSTKGALPTDRFLEFGKSALAKVDKSGDFATRWQKGERDPQLAYDYIAALNKAGKPSLKIANEYLKGKIDYTQELNCKILFEAVSEADSRLFDLLVQERTKVESVVGKEAVKKKLVQAIETSGRKACTYKSITLLEESKAKMKTYAPEQASVFGNKIQMDYMQATSDKEGYAKACEQYAREDLSGNEDAQFQLCKQMQLAFPKDLKVLDATIGIASKLCAKSEKAEHYLLLSQLYISAAKKKDAVKTAKKAIELAGEDQNLKSLAQQLLEQANETL